VGSPASSPTLLKRPVASKAASLCRANTLSLLYFNVTVHIILKLLLYSAGKVKHYFLNGKEKGNFICGKRMEIAEKNL
jgi:hypothetical protein